MNNSKFPKREASPRNCAACGCELTVKQRYCSKSCKTESLRQYEETEILDKIRDFYKRKGRIPYKKEFSQYSVARDRFGSWNEAVKAAGLKPNPVLFARRCIAIDGHECDSMAEKIIDDWLHKEGVKHERSVRYPNTRFTADFFVNDYYIEFFGLQGNDVYDNAMSRKLRMIKENKLSIVALYPGDIESEQKLEDSLGFLFEVSS